MMNQAVRVLKMLGSYALNKEQFIKSDMRDTKIEQYTAQVISESGK
jgi:hypothetical protein